MRMNVVRVAIPNETTYQASRGSEPRDAARGSQFGCGLDTGDQR